MNGNSSILAYLISLILVFGSILNCTAQDDEYVPTGEDDQKKEQKDEKPDMGNRVFFGGNFGLSFGNITNIDISPIVGYRITPRLSAGVGPTYQYLRYRDINFDSHLYGGRGFSRFGITNPNAPAIIFAHIEYELANGVTEIIDIDPPNKNFETNKREWVSSFYGGVGFMRSVGGQVGFGITVLYNFLYEGNADKLYGSPWQFRVGFIL